MKKNKTTIKWSESNNTVSGDGLGLLSVIQVVFLILKLAGLVDWEWLWVLAPTWIPLVIILAILFVVTIFIFVTAAIKYVKGEK